MADRFLRAVAVGLFGVLCQASSASAQVPDAEQRYHHGVELRWNEQDEEALAVFRDIWNETHAPRAQVQMAFAEQALGHWVAADADLEAAFTHPDDPWIANHREVMEQSRAFIAQHLGTLDVRCDVAGAEVFLDGRRVGTLPLPAPLRVEVGRVSVEVRAAGYVPVVRSVQIAPGVVSRETIVLARELPAITPAPLPTPAPVASAVLPRPRRMLQRDREADPRRGTTLHALGWAAAGGAVVAVTVGTIALVQQRSQANEFNASICRAIPEASLAGPCAAVETASNRNGALAVAGYVSGVALGVTAVGLLLTTPARRGHATGLRCGPGPGMVGAACSVEF